VRKILGLFVFLFLSTFSYATHQVGGLITYKCLGGYTYEITIIDYTNTYYNSIGTGADRDTMRIFFGDGQDSLLYRINGPSNAPNSSNLAGGDPVPNGVPICNYNWHDPEYSFPVPLPGARKINIYTVIHTYTGPGSYHVYMDDFDRMASISNLGAGGSVNIVYYMYTAININPDVPTCINSPEITNPPVCQYGCVGQCYTYNPGAYIPDLPPGSDDSIVYTLGNSLTYTPGDAPYHEDICPDYFIPAGTTLNPQTGTLRWCPTSSDVGIWNFVIIMTTYQRSYVTLGGYTSKVVVPVDTVELELEVMVEQSCATPVVNSIDTCVVAGSSLALTYTATDAGHDIYIYGTGEPFSLSPPATLSKSGGPYVSPVSTTFDWTTTCNEVRENPYQVVIRATEKFVVNDLTTDTAYYSGYGTSQITVVGPPPKNLVAVANGTTVCLHWGPTGCSRDTVYNIYRQNGCSDWKHGYCETGVPASSGYSLIATNYGLNDTTYCDNNGGAGLAPGGTFSYIVDGSFPLPDGSQSYASNDTCVKIKFGVPIITNVSVTKTDPANGEMFIRWMKPIANDSNFDSTQYPPPYTYILQHATGMSNLSFTPIATYTTAVFRTAIDTTFMDMGLNTQEDSYNYKIDFYSGTTHVGSSGTASSIYLGEHREDQSMNLSWAAIVPWTNDTFYVYRELPLPSPQVYNFIGKTTSTSYTDTGLHNGSLYCYYVKSYSQYKGDTLIKHPLYDSSETICGIPEDTIAPCAPPLYVGAKCTLYEDSVLWSNPNRLCPKANKVVSYQVLYTPVENGTMTLLTTITNPEDTLFINDGLSSVAGCYAVLAVDSAGQTSPLNTVCVDNCPIYQLPNVFTPNGDGVDDFFIPLEPYRYVQSIDINIFNRWGQIMFHTTNPGINWNGNVNNSGGQCPAGVYYYVCVVNEIRLAGIVPVTLKGFIQLIR
jgi:gliding motility-associated-like protein